MPFDRGSLLSLTFLGRLLVEFTAAKLGEDTRFLAGSLEAAQSGIEILVLANTNAGHSNLNIVRQRTAAGIRQQGGAF
jgi:hypothetical protein